MADAAARAARRGVKVPDYVMRRERWDPDLKRFRVFRLFEGFESAVPGVLRRARLARLVGDKEAARRHLANARRIREWYARLADGGDGDVAEPA